MVRTKYSIEIHRFMNVVSIPSSRGNGSDMVGSIIFNGSISLNPLKSGQWFGLLKPLLLPLLLKPLSQSPQVGAMVRTWRLVRMAERHGKVSIPSSRGNGSDKNH